jgi:hypothetical protein
MNYSHSIGLFLLLSLSPLVALDIHAEELCSELVKAIETVSSNQPPSEFADPYAWMKKDMSAGVVPKSVSRYLDLVEEAALQIKDPHLRTLYLIEKTHINAQYPLVAPQDEFMTQFLSSRDVVMKLRVKHQQMEHMFKAKHQLLLSLLERQALIASGSDPISRLPFISPESEALTRELFDPQSEYRAKAIAELKRPPVPTIFRVPEELALDARGSEEVKKMILALVRDHEMLIPDKLDRLGIKRDDHDEMHRDQREFLKNLIPLDLPYLTFHSNQLRGITQFWQSRSQQDVSILDFMAEEDRNAANNFLEASRTSPRSALKLLEEQPHLYQVLTLASSNMVDPWRLISLVSVETFIEEALEKGDFQILPMKRTARDGNYLLVTPHFQIHFWVTDNKITKGRLRVLPVSELPYLVKQQPKVNQELSSVALRSVQAKTPASLALAVKEPKTPPVALHVTPLNLSQLELSQRMTTELERLNRAYPGKHSAIELAAELVSGMVLGEEQTLFENFALGKIRKRIQLVDASLPTEPQLDTFLEIFETDLDKYLNFLSQEAAHREDRSRELTQETSSLPRFNRDTDPTSLVANVTYEFFPSNTQGTPSERIVFSDAVIVFLHTSPKAHSFISATNKGFVGTLSGSGIAPIIEDRNVPFYPLEIKNRGRGGHNRISLRRLPDGRLFAEHIFQDAFLLKNKDPLPTPPLP